MAEEIATPTESTSGELTVSPAPGTVRSLVARAREAAKVLPRPDGPLGWAEALELAPWPKGAPPAFERDFRVAFAETLVKRGIATEARDQAGRARAAEKRSWKERETKLMRRLFSATEEEFREQEAKAAKAGLSWNAWVRRRLAVAE